MSPRPLAVREAFQFAWLSYQRRAGLFIVILLAMVGAWVALEVLVVAGQNLGVVWWAAAHAAFLLAFAGLEAGFIAVCLDLQAGREPSVRDAFRHFAVAPQLLVGQLIYLVLVVAGLALLIVPGLYLASRFAFFGFSLVADKADLLAGFRSSAALSAGVQARLAGLLALLFVLNVLGACLLGLGLLVTAPVTVLVLAEVYEQLRTARSG